MHVFTVLPSLKVLALLLFIVKDIDANCQVCLVSLETVHLHDTVGPRGVDRPCASGEILVESRLPLLVAC